MKKNLVEELHARKQEIATNKAELESLYAKRLDACDKETKDAKDTELAEQVARALKAADACYNAMQGTMKTVKGCVASRLSRRPLRFFTLLTLDFLASYGRDMFDVRSSNSGAESAVQGQSEAKGRACSTASSVRLNQLLQWLC